MLKKFKTRKKYTYGDGQGLNVFDRGKLTVLEVNNDGIIDADVTESYTYNLRGEISDISNTISGNQQTISYTYNHTGQVNTIDYGTEQVLYSYDRLGRVAEIGTPSNPDFFTSYSYSNNNGTLSDEYFMDDGYSRSFTYDNHGWLKQINGSFFREVIFYHSNGYGGAGYYNGNIAAILIVDKTDLLSYDYSIIFKYDNLNRILVGDITDGMQANLDNYDLGVGTGNEIKYDANGNLLSVKEGTSVKSYVYYDGTNRVMNTDGSGSTFFQYDQNGNITYSGSDLFYDSYFNMTNLISMNSGGQTVSFKYGTINQRVEKYYWVEDMTTTTTYFHGLNDYPLIEEYYSPPYNSTILYVYGPTGLVAINDNDEWYFPIKDHLGSVRMVVKEGTSTLNSKYHYSPFGRKMYSSVNLDVPYKFTGQEYDEETGIYNFRARMYDPDLGIFYAVDPAGQGFGAYSYAGNNPVMYIDPTGKFIFSALIPGLGVFIDAMIWGSVIGGTIQGVTTNSWEGVWKGAFVGAVGGLLAPVGGAGLTFGQDVILGAFEGAFTGSLNSMLWGTDVGNGMLWGAASGAIFATATSPYTNNLLRGEGFNSNSEVFDNMIARGIDKQDILDYFGFEGSYNPGKQGPSYVDGEGYYGATSLSGEVSYGNLAFDSYDRLHYISLKENYHRTRILGGEKVLQEVPKGFSNVAQEEARGFLYAYKNRGLYPSIPQSNFLSNILSYQWATFGFDPFNSFQESWWHFIYRIPRRF